MGNLAGIPVVVEAVNASQSTAALGARFWTRRSACIPRPPCRITAPTLSANKSPSAKNPRSARRRPERHAAKSHCSPPAMQIAMSREIGLDLVSVFEHNGIEVALVEQENCCGMPKLELGDLQAVADLKAKNMPHLLAMIDRGYDIVAPIPSCVLMFKQELPLMFPDEPGCAESQAAYVRSVRISGSAAQVRIDAHGFHARSGQSRLSRGLPPTRAEYRSEDPRRSAADSRHHGGTDRAVFRVTTEHTASSASFETSP